MQDKSLSTPSIDRVSDILKWVLLAVAIICFGLLGWATVLTYEKAPPQPQAFTDPAGNVMMTADDIVAGKGGFQKADLMDYGSIYGMGSYFGEDYTASTLVRLGVLTKQSLANSAATPPGTKSPGNQSLATTGPAGTPPAADDARRRIARRRRSPTRPSPRRCRSSFRRSTLRSPGSSLPDAVAQAIRGVQAELTTKLNTVNLSAGWVPAKSLDPQLRDANRRLHHLFGDHHGRAAARSSQHVVDRELAVSSPRSATRRRPTPSIGRGSASASPSSRWASCCGSIGPISTTPTMRRWSAASPPIAR